MHVVFSSFWAIALDISSNYYFQKFAFDKTPTYKYLIGEIIIAGVYIGVFALITEYIDHNALTKTFGEYGITFLRIAIACTMYLCISFPLRKFWVFK
jgi:hypothetical protein